MQLYINSLAPGRPRCHFKTAIFNLVLLIGIFTSSNDNPQRWMPWDFTDDKSTLVQVMAWCRQATSHYLSQCWPSSMSPYGVTRPQWVNWVIFNLVSKIDILSISCEIALWWILQEPLWYSVNIGTSNGLVPSGYKPLPELMLTRSVTLYSIARPQ